MAGVLCSNSRRRGIHSHVYLVYHWWSATAAWTRHPRTHFFLVILCFRILHKEIWCVMIMEKLSLLVALVSPKKFFHYYLNWRNTSNVCTTRVSQKHFHYYLNKRNSKEEGVLIFYSSALLQLGTTHAKAWSMPHSQN